MNDFLKSYGGHIGFGIRPTERRKGYGSIILRKALDFCREISLQRVMLACYKDNVASRKTIERCWGILEKEFALTELKNFPFEIVGLDDKTVQIYWITLKNFSPAEN